MIKYCGVVAVGLLLGCATVEPSRPVETSLPTNIQDCEHCPEMVIVPPGAFVMGGKDPAEGRPEGPQRPVTINYYFAVGKYEVTVAEFRYFLNSSGHRVTPGCRIWIEGELPPGATQPNPEPTGGPWRGFATDTTSGWLTPHWRRPVADDDPVACVSWLDALAYVDWLAETTGQAYRLLTEAEWEYVARAGGSGKFPWGNDGSRGCLHANIYDQQAVREFDFPWAGEACDDGFPAAAPVGQYRPNRFGVYDMIGNVWEWTHDCYQEYYPEEPIDGRPVLSVGPCEARTIRGGSWITATVRQRLTFRGRDPEDTRNSFFGFRVARDITD